MKSIINNYKYLMFMENNVFLREELNEIEALEVRGGTGATMYAQGECTNTAYGCGGGVDQTKCVNKADGCGRDNTEVPPGSPGD